MKLDKDDVVLVPRQNMPHNSDGVSPIRPLCSSHFSPTFWLQGTHQNSTTSGIQGVSLLILAEWGALSIAAVVLECLNNIGHLVSTAIDYLAAPGICSWHRVHMTSPHFNSPEKTKFTSSRYKGYTNASPLLPVLALALLHREAQSRCYLWRRVNSIRFPNI